MRGMGDVPIGDLRDLPGRILENPVCHRLFFSGIGEGNFAFA